ncbi:MAG: UDP-glucose 4-epimerase GalE [Coriobacteriia bacterium]
MRILATGGAGYIGSITVRMLADEGHSVTVIDTLENGHAQAVDPRARLVVGDVGSPEVVREALAGVDAVVHFAGYADVAESVREPERYFENNVRSASVMLDVMEELGVDRIVFSSTAAVYGEPERVPIEEDDPTRPCNPYGESKLAFEEELDRRIPGGLRATRLRYFNVAGAWHDGSLGEAHPVENHIIPRVLSAVAEGRREFEVFGGDYPTPDGTCVRDYIHVVDLARAHVSALERLAAGETGLTCNLGSSRGYSNLEVVRACGVVTGVALDVVMGPRRPGDPAVLVASNRRAAVAFGWSPVRDLQTMVADAWCWHSSGLCREWTTG